MSKYNPSTCQVDGLYIVQFVLCYNVAMTIYIIIGILAVVGLWFVASYNSFIRLINRVKEAWADIDVQLKRRYDLIPNLVETVKGYAGHERATLDDVITARNNATQVHIDPS